MSSNYNIVYDYIKSNPMSTLDDICAGLGLKKSQVRLAIRDIRLIRNDLITAQTEITKTGKLSYDNKLLGRPLSCYYISENDNEVTHSGRLHYIYDFIRKNPYCAVKDISVNTSIRENSVRIALKKMLNIFPDLCKELTQEKYSNIATYKYYIAIKK